VRLLSSGKILLILIAAGCSLPGPSLERFEYRQLHMGVVTRIVLYAPEASSAPAAARGAFERIATLDSLLSDFRDDSELMQLAARAGGPPVPVSDELFHVLSHAQQLAQRSDGRFDVTIGPLVRLWRQARRTGQLPDAAALAAAAERVGWERVRLDSAAQAVQLLAPGMQLDLGGIAKGYAAGEALATLRRAGVSRALVEMGGDLVVGDPPPGQRGWRIHLPNAPPGEQDVVLANAAVSSSGDTQQFLEIDGTRYSHVVDPRTGLGLRSRNAATVISTDGITADALSTLLTILGPAEGHAFVADHFPGTTAFIRQAEASDDRQDPYRPRH
jgi:FAD:protein FMN transferase